MPIYRHLNGNVKDVEEEKPKSSMNARKWKWEVTDD